MKKSGKKLTWSIFLLVLVLSLLGWVGGNAVQAAQDGGVPVVSITANGAFIKADGTLWTWGDNDYGQLGDGTTIKRTTPVQVVELQDVVAVSRSGHTVALKSDGTVWTWGWNYFGQLGNGTYGDNAWANPVPAKVEGLNDVVLVEAPGTYTVALKADGTVWAWGRNNYGQLGNGTEYGNQPFTPVQVKGLEDVVAVAANLNNAIALKSDGTVWHWGSHQDYSFSQVRPTIVTYLTPIQVEGLQDVLAVKRLADSFIALKDDGTAWIVGWQGPDSGVIPIQVEGLKGVVDVVKLNNSLVSLKKDGTVWVMPWEGQNSGDVPIQVDELKDIIAITAGSSHVAALKMDGTVWTWGDNSYGQLGDGTTAYRHTPVQVDSLQDVTAVVSGESHTLALKADGTIWAWGFNEDYQLGDGTNVHRLTPVQITGFHRFTGNQIALRLGHQEMQITDYKGDTVTRQLDAAPYIDNNYTMIPIRAFEGFGSNINYDNGTKVITFSKGGNIVKVQTGSSIAEVNGQKIRMPMPVTNISGRTYLPLRFVAENLGMGVLWLDDTKEIFIQNSW